MTRWTWLVVFLLETLGVCGATAVRSTGCAPTVEAAIAKLLAQERAVGETGYRIAAVRVDPLRRQTWAMVASCSAPAAPMVAVPLQVGLAMSEAILVPRVRIGEPVKVTRHGDGSTMELSGLAIEAGVVGESIRIRLHRFGDDSSEAAPVIVCRVVGPGVVEVLQ